MELCFFIYVSSDVAQCETFDRVIESRESDVTYSHGVCGGILLGDDSIKQRLISAVHLRVIMVNIDCARWKHGFIAIVR